MILGRTTSWHKKVDVRCTLYVTKGLTKGVNKLCKCLIQRNKKNRKKNSSELLTWYVYSISESTGIITINISSQDCHNSKL